MGSIKTFSDISGIPEWLIDQLTQLNIERPSKVQKATIPEALKGKDIIGSARTGQGKTLCFAIPILASIALDPGAFRAVIVTPTRELALQITQQFKLLGKSIHIHVLSLTGGHDMGEQILELQKKPHVLVCTPGRLARILSDEVNKPLLVSMKRIKYFVLDEADRLLTPEFSKELSIVMDHIPKNRQNMLYSATLTKSIERATSMSEEKPFVFVDNEGDVEYETTFDEKENKQVFMIPETLKMSYMFMPQNVKECYLLYILRKFDHLDSIIIFAPSCKVCEEISAMLNQTNPPIRNARLHRWVKQNEREKALSSFKSGYAKVLVATDLASRGLDIPECKMVIHYNVPNDPKDFIHRSGRVARKGREGHTMVLVDQYQVKLLLQIEEQLPRKVEEWKEDEDIILKHMNDAVTAKELGRLVLDEDGFYERIQTLTERRKRQKMEEASESKSKRKKVKSK